MKTSKFKWLYDVGDWFFEKFMALRGTFYNRIVKLVIFAGLALCMEPFWEPILNAFLEKKFAISIPTNNAPWLGLILVIVGLIFLYLREKSDKGELSFSNADKRQHDTACLRGLTQTASFETVRDSLDWIATNDAFFNRQKDPMRHHALYLANVENEFLDKNLHALAMTYSESLRTLFGFLTTHFFTYPEFKLEPDGFQFCLYPNWNADRAGGGTPDEDRKYAEKAKQLDKLLNDASLAQAALITGLKTSLGSSFYEKSR